jgi:carbonic anhydrase
MSEIDHLLENNAALSGAVVEDRPDAELEYPSAQPSRRVAIVACMDARLELDRALALDPGEVHLLRNAGGVVTDDMIRSLAISQRRLGTREIMLIHHTDCGMATFTEDEFRDELRRDTGMAPPFAIESFSDVDEDVRQSLRRVRNSPFVPHRDAVRGFVYDVETHRLREVVDGS